MFFNNVAWTCYTTGVLFTLSPLWFAFCFGSMLFFHHLLLEYDSILFISCHPYHQFVIDCVVCVYHKIDWYFTWFSFFPPPAQCLAPSLCSYSCLTARPCQSLYLRLLQAQVYIFQLQSLWVFCWLYVVTKLKICLLWLLFLIFWKLNWLIQSVNYDYI